MAEAVGYRRLWAHEKVQGGLILGLLVVLAIRAGPLHRATMLMAALAVYQVVTVLLLRGRASALAQKLRLASAYPVALGLFSCPAYVVPALRLTPIDAQLLSIDRWLLGETPSIVLARYTAPWLTEVMSGFYVTYHLYFHGALAYALLKPLERGRKIFEYMFTALPAGVLGYLTFPALGPFRVLGDHFEHPFRGGWITALNAEIVRHGSAVYDVFPSLHIFMTCVILDHDRVEHPRRFKWMLPIALGLFASTLYLRYHYAIDLLAGVVWFLALRTWWVVREKRVVHDPNIAPHVRPSMREM